MKYLIVSVNGKNEPVILGKGIDVDAVVTALGGNVVSGGEAIVQNMLLTCQGTITVNGKEIGSRGMKDEVLLRASDFIE